MQHFISIKDLTRLQLEQLLDDTDRRAATMNCEQEKTYGRVNIASLFFENSTRTRVSFELAAQHLGAHFVNVDLAQSSQRKGESVWDTVATLQAMGINQFIVRTSEVGLPLALARRVNAGVSLISAGEAHVSHPSQGLLDLVTLRQCKGAIEKLSIAIVGDIAHSRVARSFFEGATLLGCKDIRLIAPQVWHADDSEFVGAQRLTDCNQGVEDVDVVMALRIQKERMAGDLKMNLDDYRQQYSISSARLIGARPDVLVMHPGPINRNVEITDEIADGPRSVIHKQVQLGVPARMAIISALAQ